MPESLAEIYKRHATPPDPMVSHGDKGTQHSYIDVYEHLLAPYRAGCTLMEIGIACGLSLSMWREYMPSSRIIGVDLSIVFDLAPHISTGTILVAADATKPAFLNSIKNEQFDVVIDDASHMAADQRATFRLVKPQMRKGGIYIIEDILSIDTERIAFSVMHPSMKVYDLRSQKGLYCDVMLVYRF